MAAKGAKVKLGNKSDQAVFKQKMADFKQAIEQEIADYASAQRQTVPAHYGQYSKLETDTFLATLEAGGKRLRGALVMMGYEMSGGRDLKMIVQVARAIEMFHAYLLIIDDIQDRSDVRRGKPAAHVRLADYHRSKKLRGQAEHFGVAMALNSALGGAHAAQMLLANINADAELRLNVLGITNRTLAVTIHGQTNDIFNEVSHSVSLEQIERVLEWKTAQYSLLNPLHVGMVLAGADCRATDAITPYASLVGRVFQITDDVIGVYGSASELGKNPLDDIREGKQTVLTQYALQYGTKSQQNYLKRHLGSPEVDELVLSEVRAIFEQTGARRWAQDLAKQYTQQATASLNNHAGLWAADGLQFLRGLAEYLLKRTH